MAERLAPQVSIIIPVYNVEGYLRRCLDSVLAQTTPDWECVCVDDGSIDGSGAILDEYAAKDGRFVVLHQKNEGVASARNAGLNAARGEYIGFVDPDDWIEPNTYELALEAAKRTGADIVQWRCIAEKENGPVPSREMPEGFFDIAQNKEYFFAHVWLHLFRGGFISQNNLRFPAGIRVGEDYYFSFAAYAYAKTGFFINLPLYHYERTRPTSLISSAWKEDLRLETTEARENACKLIAQVEGKLKSEGALSNWGGGGLTFVTTQN